MPIVVIMKKKVLLFFALLLFLFASSCQLKSMPADTLSELEGTLYMSESEETESEAEGNAETESKSNYYNISIKPEEMNILMDEKLYDDSMMGRSLIDKHIVKVYKNLWVGSSIESFVDECEKNPYVNVGYYVFDEHQVWELRVTEEGKVSIVKELKPSYQFIKDFKMQGKAVEILGKSCYILSVVCMDNSDPPFLKYGRNNCFITTQGIYVKHYEYLTQDAVVLEENQYQKYMAAYVAYHLDPNVEAESGDQGAIGDSVYCSLEEFISNEKLLKKYLQKGS